MLLLTYNDVVLKRLNDLVRAVGSGEHFPEVSYGPEGIAAQSVEEVAPKLR